MITVNTSDPIGLLVAIKKEIVDQKIETWECDSEGDFTHTPNQWYKIAWLKPTIPKTNNMLVLKLLRPKDTEIEKYTSGVYQGRFIEMLSNHFPTKFTTIDSTKP